MLVNLHVKDLALIKEADIDFKEGLNVLTGETGAGKSIVIGSITLALGGKISKEIIRAGEESALVELVFVLKDEGTIEGNLARHLRRRRHGCLGHWHGRDVHRYRASSKAPQAGIAHDRG